ncbi:MAG TPA: succinate dehydrogenase assembly factor 2 [Methylococcaceae bacterium]|nr:succinate dehydrogenase assembly factor 2 [Methylococcaceae bacterium]
MKATQLYWRCRRGGLELDLLLKHYLENHYATASATQQAEFVALLELEDDRLLPALLLFLKENNATLRF